VNGEHAACGVGFVAAIDAAQAILSGRLPLPTRFVKVRALDV
jgi:hypothetical protein